jgi:hypothetical protein
LSRDNIRHVLCWGLSSELRQYANGKSLMRLTTDAINKKNFITGGKWIFLKRLLIAALLLSMAMLTGCRPATGDITDLMNPPKLTADQQAIEKALDVTLGKGKYKLKYPIAGEYRSAIILRNLDSDQEDEAIAFYCPNTDNAGTHVLVLKKENGAWKKVDDFNGDGNEVEQIAFGDYYGNGHDDIAIAWTQLTGTDFGLSVYRLDGKKYKYSGTLTDMKTVSLSGGGKQDILLLKLDQVAHQATASLISYKAGRLQDISDTSLDPTVSGYAGIYNTTVDSKNAVLVDDYKGTNGMVTELLTFSKGRLQAPLLDKYKKYVTKTLRDVPITCEDLYGDGVYEIPGAVELPGYDNVTNFNQKPWLVSWSTISGDTLSPPKYSCVINNTESYYFIFPQKWINSNNVAVNTTVDISGGDNSWSFRVWNGQKMGETLFSLNTYTPSEWKFISGTAGNYEITENNGVVYSVELNPKASGAAGYLDYNEVKQEFRLMD